MANNRIKAVASNTAKLGKIKWMKTINTHITTQFQWPQHHYIYILLDDYQ